MADIKRGKIVVTRKLKPNMSKPITVKPKVVVKSRVIIKPKVVVKSRVIIKPKVVKPEILTGSLCDETTYHRYIQGELVLISEDNEFIYDRQNKKLIGRIYNESDIEWYGEDGEVIEEDDSSFFEWY